MSERGPKKDSPALQAAKNWMCARGGFLTMKDLTARQTDLNAIMKELTDTEAKDFLNWQQEQLFRQMMGGGGQLQ